jgi:DivIVA domain-containing protein
MADDRRISADEVASRAFGSSFRGLDPTEVRTWLSRVADELRRAAERESALHARLVEAEERAAHPELDEDTLLRLLGDETARVMKSAREASTDLRARAEDNVRQLLKEAHEEARRVRAAAESVLAKRIEEAEAAKAEQRAAAEQEAAALVDGAKAEADRIVADVREQGKEMLAEAQAARERILGDLAKRRRVAHVQVEQLRAGRDRLLEAYRMVRSTLDDVTNELQRAEAEARQAAESAGRRAEEELPTSPTPEFEPESEAEPAEPEAVVEAVAPVAAPAPAPSGPRLVTTTIAAAAPSPIPAPEPRPNPEERKSTSLRILRRSKVEEGEPETEPELDAVDEGVRIIEEPAPEPEPEVGAEAEAHKEVEDLFARIRADRAQAVAHARDVLAEPEAEPEADSETEAAPEVEAPAQAEAEAPVTDADERALQQRDEALVDIETRLARKLKRSLQDEQNDLLDRLRNAKGRLAPADVIPPADQHAARHRDMAESFLQEAASAGAGFAAGAEDPGAAQGVGDLARELAHAIVGPLRRQLERAIEATGDDEDGPSSRVGMAYREWKGERIETLAGDAVMAAFARGQFQALPAGTQLRWVVDDQGGRCPDCDDNALAGSVAKGQEYPTGQQHPPAHSGCRCLVVPV